MITLAVALVALAALLYYGTRNFDYWKKKGVKYEKPLPFFGNNLKGFLQMKSYAQYALEYYKKYPNEKVVGFFRAMKPELLIHDPEYVRRIIFQDFAHFHSRGLITHKKVVQPLFRNLFFLEGDNWKLLRQRMTPLFTSGKLKAMFPLIVERAEKLKARTLSSAAEGATLDAKELMARYTTDFIGACGFGVDADSLNNEDSEFRKLGASIFGSYRLKDIFYSFLKDVFPELAKNLTVLQHIEDDMKDFVGSVLKKRNYQPCGRGDFVDLLLECQKMGTIYGESIEHIHNGVPEKASLEFDDDLIMAQIFVFFAAGFETSSAATSFTLHQLAYHPKVQEKVQKEIDHVLSKHNGKLCYDAIKEMTYLEWTLKEAMRIFPLLGVLVRECARPYYFPEIDLKIDPGVKVFIPVIGFHTDPQYFTDPEEFRPERFHPDEFGTMQKQLYMPFGDGPRNCIGARLGLMQSVAGLAAILSAFTVEPAPETVRYPEISTKSTVIQNVKSGLPLLFKERKSTL
ncbi:hypothetical protein K1T71_014043 [Dendrolimus kikuchii]|uniref:Uncharacterized protein n=1 Tax=Dendrolimus kikuchii TaxID=765133 RepID=A0ACC1CEU3_9NEOP|nr:hypothetical protein K1T71_014043 [Dendrolimus kikuchii]